MSVLDSSPELSTIGDQPTSPRTTIESVTTPRTQYQPSPPLGSSGGQMGGSKAYSGSIGTQDCRPDLYDPPFSHQCLLSFDGGGIRGLSSLIIMRRLMEKVKQRESADACNSSYHPIEYPENGCIHNSIPSSPVQSRTSSFPRKPIISQSNSQPQCGQHCRYLPCHYFDYIGGTSTGGLIAIMLGRLRMSVQDCDIEYRNLSKSVFGNPRKVSVRGPVLWPRDKYDERALQRAINNVVLRRLSRTGRSIGGANFNSAPGLCRTLVFALAEKIDDAAMEYDNVIISDTKKHDVEGSSPYVFRSYDHWGPADNCVIQNPGPANSIPIWEVARATTAAPTYFNAIEISNRRFIDGAFGINNPTVEIFREALSMNGDNLKDIKLIVSIGTGKATEESCGTGWGKYLKLIHAAKRKVCNTETTHDYMNDYKRLHNVPYYRLNVPEKYGLHKIKLDEYKSLERIESITNQYCAEIENDLNEIAAIMVQHRRPRSHTEWWHLLSTGSQLRCTVDNCRRKQELLKKPCDLLTHLENTHSIEQDNNMATHKYLKDGMVIM